MELSKSFWIEFQEEKVFFLKLFLSWYQCIFLHFMDSSTLRTKLSFAAPIILATANVLTIVYEFKYLFMVRNHLFGTAKD